MGRFFWAISIVFLSAVNGSVAQEPLDYLIKNGLVFDGTGSDGQIVDIGIRDDRIVFVGTASDLSAENTIDAGGFIVAPGFIDPHTHAYGERPAEGPDHLTSYVTQGVTTILSGNDGGGPADTASALKVISDRGIGANFGLFVGHGSVRRQVIGMQNRQATTEELDQMKGLVADAMEAGALGLSSGLFYAPGSFAQTEEVVELAKVAARYGGVYESHLRDESNYSIGVVAAVQEALEIGRKAQIPVHIAHIKALGVDVWGKSSAIISIIEDAQADGLQVTADQYPWLASGTGISAALIPRTAMAGGREALLERLRDPLQLPALKEAMAENLRRRGGAQSILLTGGNDGWRGLRLSEYADRENVTPVNAAVQIVLDGDARIASFNMNENDVRNFMGRPWVMTSSDGGDGHPRKFASFPQKYRKFVVEEKDLTLAEFIYRSTALTASTFGITDRGLLAGGAFADILIFDPETFSPRATFENADLTSTGVQYLFVNGAPLIWREKHLKTIHGRVIIPDKSG